MFGLPSLKVDDMSACPRCGGYGEVYLAPCYYPCPDCDGTGHFTPEMMALDGDEDEFFSEPLDAVTTA